MLFYLSKCSTPSNIVIRMVDADVFFIALGSLHLLAEGKQVWTETGLVTKSTLRYININQIHDHFGVRIFQRFLVYQAASLNRKGKIRPMNLLKQWICMTGMQSQKKTPKLWIVLYVQCMVKNDSNPSMNYV